jgi:hypothetical protein
LESRLLEKALQKLLKDLVLPEDFCVSGAPSATTDVAGKTRFV